MAEADKPTGPADGANPLDALFAAAPAVADDEEVYLWPECVPLWSHWQEVQTQWRVGMSGATGLDYAGVTAYLATVEPDEVERREAFAAIREAERAVLSVWADERAKKAKQH